MDPEAAIVKSVQSVPVVQSVPNVVQSVPNVVQSVLQSVYNAQEQEFNEILRELNLESLLLNVKNVLDLDFILKGVYIFLGELGAYVSIEVKNTWIIKAII